MDSPEQPASTQRKGHLLHIAIVLQLPHWMDVAGSARHRMGAPDGRGFAPPPLRIIRSGSLRHCPYCHAPLIRLAIVSIRPLRYPSHVRWCNASASVALSWMPRVCNENWRQKCSCPRGHHDLCQGVAWQQLARQPTSFAEAFTH